jgi:hypothetical protein
VIRSLLLFPLLAACASCANSASTRPDMRTQLDAIARQCRLAPGVFEVRPPDDLHFRPSPDARYEDVDCAIAALNKANLPLKLGFVGNEAFVPGNSQ